MKMYVIFVKTGRENAVIRELKKRGFDAILPVKRDSGKPEIIFENYVFLKCKMTEKICSEITKIRDIHYILGLNDGNCVPFLKKSEQNYIERLWSGGNLGGKNDDERRGIPKITGKNRKI